MKPVLIKLMSMDLDRTYAYQIKRISTKSHCPIQLYHEAAFCVAGAAFDGSLLGLAVVFVRLGPRMGRVVRRYVLCALCELRGRRDAG